MLGNLKKLPRNIYNRFYFLRKSWRLIKFVFSNGYVPNFKNPRSFNEKINYRKNNPLNKLFSVCSDKVAAKEWVSSIIGDEYIIPNYFVGDTITPDLIKKILREKGDCLLKANHNSGRVYLLTAESSEQEIKAACDGIKKVLNNDFGKITGEKWYSSIKPKVLIEKRLLPEEGESDIRDYKFHVFMQNDGTQRVILQVDFDRNNNHNRSFFDEELRWLPFSVKRPTIHTRLEKPKSYDKMIELAKELATPFSYVRVDFYNVEGKIFFGEMTFAHGSGYEEFSMSAYDFWLGRLWEGDPAY